MKKPRRSHNSCAARTYIIDRLNAMAFYKPQNAYFAAFNLLNEMDSHFKVTQLFRAEMRGIIYAYAQIEWYKECQFLYFHEGVPYKDQKDYEAIQRLGMQGHHVWKANGNIYAVSPITQQTNETRN